MKLNLNEIPRDIGYYLAGFADGEGSFNISFRKRDDYTTGWKVSACFNVSQKERIILTLFKQHLKCGTLRSRPDGIWYYEVNNLNALRENVIPFFWKFNFLSAKKKKDFSTFCKIIKLLEFNDHHSIEGIQKILELRENMNNGGNRKFSSQEILDSIIKESPETVRQTQHLS